MRSIRLSRDQEVGYITLKCTMFTSNPSNVYIIIKRLIGRGHILDFIDLLKKKSSV